MVELNLVLCAKSLDHVPTPIMVVGGIRNGGDKRSREVFRVKVQVALSKILVSHIKRNRIV